MTKRLKKAIVDINKAIEERNISDFISEFWDGSLTYGFVFNCTINNRLDINEIEEYSEELQKNYIYNILVFWLGVPMEKALKICK